MMFLDYPFNVNIESASIANCTSFVCDLVHITDCDGGGEFFCGEAVFPRSEERRVGKECA